jgi:hypothetical protein
VPGAKRSGPVPFDLPSRDPYLRQKFPARRVDPPSLAQPCRTDLDAAAASLEPEPGAEFQMRAAALIPFADETNLLDAPTRPVTSDSDTLSKTGGRLQRPMAVNLRVACVVLDGMAIRQLSRTHRGRLFTTPFRANFRVDAGVESFGLPYVFRSLSSSPGPLPAERRGLGPK